MSPAEGTEAAPNRDLWGPHFLEKLLAETHTVMELCSFRKGTILPHLRCTVGTLHTQPVESLGLSHHSVTHPAEFILPGPSEGMVELGLSQVGFWLGIRQVVLLGCVATSLGSGRSYLPCKLSLLLS